MPVTIGTDTYDYFDGSRINYLKTPHRTSKPRKKYPLEGNSSIYVIEEEYWQLIDYYEPLLPSTRHPTESSTFFVGDSDVSDIGSGVGKFTRKWSLLPGAGDKNYIRTEYESYAYSVPGIDTAQELFYQFNVASYTLSNGIYTIVAAGAAAPFNVLDIAVGKPVTIIYNVTDPLNGNVQTRNVVKTALSVSGLTVTVPQFFDINTPTITGVRRADIKQNSYTKVVMSKIEYNYYIVGVNCSSIETIPIIEQQQIIDNTTGGRVDYLSETTTPSIDDWYGYIEDGKWICVEGSVVRRWQGNIFERATRYVRAVI